METDPFSLQRAVFYGNAAPEATRLKIDEIVELLNRIGLEREEALVYANLQLIGPSGAGDLAGAAKLSRPQTYRTLERLTERGLVASDLSRPRKYTALPPSQLVQYFHARQESMLKELRQIEPQILEALTPTQRMEVGRAHPRFDLLRGRQVVFTRAHELYDRAQSEILLITTHPGGLKMLRSGGGFDRLVARAGTGVQVRIVVRAGAESAQTVSELADVPNLEIRALGTDEMWGSAVVDGKFSLTILVGDPKTYPRSDESVAFTTDAPNFVQLQRASFQALWEKAEPLIEPRAKSGEKSRNEASRGDRRD